jgi:hypothetical protein
VARLTAEVLVARRATGGILGCGPPELEITELFGPASPALSHFGAKQIDADVVREHWDYANSLLCISTVIVVDAAGACLMPRAQRLVTRTGKVSGLDTSCRGKDFSLG